MRRATANPEILLAWARDRDGARLHVAQLDAKDRGARAPFRCIGCGDTLVAKLGRVRAHHFAHRPGSSCPLTAPETALHLNVKERLLELCAAAFAGERRVVLETRCPSCRRRSPVELHAQGDGAIAEGQAGRLRADVLVTRAGAPALALEVKVSHAMGAAKEAALSAAGLRAVEIDAWSEWEREEDGATIVACTRNVGFASCGGCQTAARADAGRSAGGEAGAIAELEAYRARGLFRPAPGAALATTKPFTSEERRNLARSFECAHCGSRTIAMGERLARHACPGKDARAVAWRGYDGVLVSLAWWKGR